MQDKANGDSSEVNDQTAQQPQDCRNAAQKRTFTRWINHLLQRRDPPVEVHDLFTDIQDGRVLMALLEELSGCKLLYRFRSSSHRIFRLNNISKALAFLDDRHVRLLGIDASGIVDGIPSVVLNLIWNIILHFQVKEVTGGLQRHLSSSLSSSSVSSYASSDDLTPHKNDNSSYSCKSLPRKSRKAAREPKYQGKAVKTLLQWVQGCTTKFRVEVQDFGKSWRSGLPFLALIKSINPALIDLMESQAKEPRANIQLALDVAHHSLDIPPLLQLEDVLCKSPDEKSIITYVSMFLRHCKGGEKDPKTSTEVPWIPNFGSLESVNFGDIPSDEPEAQTLLKGLERSTEQQLWRRWATRRSPGSTCTNSLHKGGAASELSSSCGDIFSSCHSQDFTDQLAGSTSAYTKKRNNSRNVFKSPSPLDASITSQEIRSWMEKASLGQSYSKPRVDESRFSLSSEEGIYSLSVLDSDEEEAYSYILELNKEDLQPYNQMKRQVPRVEEETAEEMLLNGQQTEESKHLEVSEDSSESKCKHQEDSLEGNIALEVQARSDRKSDRQPEDEGPEGHNEDTDFGRQRSGCEYAPLETLNRTDSLLDFEETELFEVEDTVESGLFKKCGEPVEEKLVDKAEQDEKMTTLNEMKDRNVDKGGGKNEERRNQLSDINVESYKMEENENLVFEDVLFEVRGADSAWINAKAKLDREDNVSRIENLTNIDEDEEGHSDEDTYWMDSEEGLSEEEKNSEQKRTYKNATKTNSPAQTSSKYDIDGDTKVHGDDYGWTPAARTTSQSLSRGGGSVLQSLVASWDVTPLEMEMLLFLWILLYCCLILSQLNL